VEIGTETPIFLFWEYLFLNFGILSLQCGDISDALYILLLHILNCLDFQGPPLPMILIMDFDLHPEGGVVPLNGGGFGCVSG
jgi:hypothetical protein